ncbi:MAG: hypothetical protein M3N19_05985 [Candidatus Eremiobacteraeota bacterium]|nr:hypothetical protein [Candidatus Eremiobacteraeota bacterium]
MLKRWQIYLALLAVILGSLSTMADKPRTTYIMIGAALALLGVVVVSLLRGVGRPPKKASFDAAAQAERIREQRDKRFHRDL